jgi:hypothetical protein
MSFASLYLDLCLGPFQSLLESYNNCFVVDVGEGKALLQARTTTLLSNMIFRSSPHLNRDKCTHAPLPMLTHQYPRFLFRQSSLFQLQPNRRMMDHTLRMTLSDGSSAAKAPLGS